MVLLWSLLLLLSGCGEEKNLECPEASALEARLAHTGFLFSVKTVVDARGTNWHATFMEVPVAPRDALRRRQVLVEYLQACDVCLKDSVERNDEGTRILVAKRAMVRLILNPVRGLPRGI